MQSENEKKKRRDEKVGNDSGFYIGKERCVDDQKVSATAAPPGSAET